MRKLSDVRWARFVGAHRWWLLTLAMLVILLPIASWLAIRAINPYGAAIPVPIGAGREIDINYWTTVDGLGVALWYQDATTNVKMVSGDLSLVQWLLVVIAIVMLAWIWRR